MDLAKFSGLMTILRLSYPGMARIDDAFWRDAIKVYHERLSSKFSEFTISRAFDQAVKAHADWFPNLGQLIEICEYHAKNERTALPPDRQITEGVDEPWSGDGEERARKIIARLAKAKGAP